MKQSLITAELNVNKPQEYSCKEIIMHNKKKLPPEIHVHVFLFILGNLRANSILSPK